ncbi:MAG TPA: hypothetical protein VER33_07345 [Polyangiaceae bacterium]|nr:hypothetical protein [Polyangiaceae bacterium]
MILPLLAIAHDRRARGLEARDGVAHGCFEQGLEVRMIHLTLAPRYSVNQLLRPWNAANWLGG